MFLLQASTSELFSVADLRLIAPEMILTVCACVALVMEVVLPKRQSRWAGYFALAGLLLAAVSVFVLGRGFLFPPGGVAPAALSGFSVTVRIAGFAVLFNLFFLPAPPLTVASSLLYLG